MSAKYIIRLDDACEQMDLKKWSLLTKAFLDRNIKPIVAIIPENRDRVLRIQDDLNDDFNSLLKIWTKNNWLLAQHGCYHLYHKIPFWKSFHPINSYSEFSGLDVNVQLDLINKGRDVLLKKGVSSGTFVFPGHHFDLNSLKLLVSHPDFIGICDGYFVWPMSLFGLNILPQQLWGFKRKFFGVWVVNLHPNTMTQEEILAFVESLDDSFISNRIADPHGITYTKNAFLIILNFVYYLYCYAFQTLKNIVKRSP